MYSHIYIYRPACLRPVLVTMVTYAVKEDTQVIREPTSLWTACLVGWPRYSGSASSRSAWAVLFGSSSRISTNSSTCMRLTNLAGTGGRQLARQNSKAVGLAWAVTAAVG